MHDNNKEQSSSKEEAENGWQTPGIALRKARRERELSEEEVCKQLGLGVGALKALEADDFSRLPTAIYVRGYIRSYCALLGIPEEPILGSYEKYSQEMAENTVDETTEGSLPAPLPVWKKPLFWAAVVTVLVVAVLLVMRGMSTDAGASQPVHGGSVSVPSDLTPLQLRFEGTTWVEVVDSRDDILLAAMKQSGQEEALHGVPPFKLRVGDADAVKIEYAGQSVEVESTTKVALTEITVGQ